MSSLWQHQFYYLFGFLALVLVILVITCAEISIALTYFQLTSENYNWWWRSFLASGSSAFYVFLYSILYFSSRLQIDKMVSTLLYFGYMSIVSLLFFLLTGAIGLIASFFFVLNLFIWGQRSSGAVPFSTMFAVLVLWFGISVPLCFLGSYFGFRREAIELPVRTNHVPRQIPSQAWFMQPFFTCALGGILPFGAVFTELFFIMSSLWQHQFYYLFGFLALVLAILVITCAEISIALTYFQLTSENYNWWWRSFLASGSSAFYVFLYSILYFSSRLQIDKMVSTLLYFGYMSILSLLFFLLTGSIGLIASFSFVKVIYGSIKVD